MISTVPETANYYSATTIGFVLCGACGCHFRRDGPQLPVTFGCGDTVCFECADAVVSVDTPACPLCEQPVALEFSKNIALGQLAEWMFEVRLVKRTLGE